MRHFIVPEMASFEDDWHFSHAVRLGELLLLSGVTGTRTDGTVASDPAEQFEQAFEHLGLYLRAAGAGFGDIAELTSYHVGLREHLDAFTAVKDRYLHRPFPAWSAIGVAELITPGALVEVRVVARAPEHAGA
jgi:enamine deaminase RidA (YjgF/YER057c/UK114 family)